MPYIRIVYKTNGFDYVPAHLLNSLITTEEISHFYRASEKRWIDVLFDPIRGKGGHYQGPDRRNVPKPGEKGFSKAKRPRTNWFECLWRYHGQEDW